MQSTRIIMASSSVTNEVGSDKNCVESCNLKYGISEAFNKTVIEQQNVKASKAHIIPNLFNDPEEQAKFKHLIKDPLFKILDNGSAKQVFQKALEGMEKNYPKILSGTEKNMFYCPAAFNFDSRIGSKETSVPDVLDGMKASLETKQNLTPQEEANLKVIRNHLQKLRPQMAEQEFVDALACFFYQQRGIFIHSLKLDQHLKVLTDITKMNRRQNKNYRLAMTDLEEKLAEHLQISQQKLSNFANVIVEHLKTDLNVSNIQQIKGRLVRKAVDEKLKGNENMYVKKHFKAGSDYSIEEVMDGVKLGKFQCECEFAGENDLLIMLPDSKLILCIEIKRHMSSTTQMDSCSNERQSIDRNMKYASRQLTKNAKFLSLRHGAILSPEWRFAKICAVSPIFNKSERICNNCQRFILTSDILKTQVGLDKWWKENGLADRARHFSTKEKAYGYNEFQLFFNRLVCLSSVRVIPDPFHTWTQVQGDNPHHMSAGHTKAPLNAQAQYASGFDGIKDVLNHSHNAFKVAFFNKDQISLLTSDKLFDVIFMCDFGAGNMT